MNRGTHGNPETVQQDRAIRAELRSRLYDVLEITAAKLTDKGAMAKRFYQVGPYLIGTTQAKHIHDNPEWFTASNPET